MTDIDAKLKMFNLDDPQLLGAMNCARASMFEERDRLSFIVETVIVSNGVTVVTNREESNV